MPTTESPCHPIEYYGNYGAPSHPVAELLSLMSTAGHAQTPPDRCPRPAASHLLRHQPFCGSRRTPAHTHMHAPARRPTHARWGSSCLKVVCGAEDFVAVHARIQLRRAPMQSIPLPQHASRLRQSLRRCGVVPAAQMWEAATDERYLSVDAVDRGLTHPKRQCCAQDARLHLSDTPSADAVRPRPAQEM